MNALPDLHIEIGSTALVGIDAAGEPVVTGGAASELTAGELDMLARVQGRLDDALGANSVATSTTLPTPPIPKNHVRFTFVAIEGGEQSLLIIRNGFDQAFAYKARIGVADKSAATDVCQVLPARTAFEHWPYKIGWIEITAIRAADWKDGSPPRCE